MHIPEKGMASHEIMQTLKGFKKDDVDFRGGKVFAYTFLPGDEAEDIIKQAYMLFLDENGLDPTSFPSLVRLECEVVRFVADLLRGGPQAVGNFTSGGTESIMLAVKTARDHARAHKPRIKEPEVIFPRTAHCAFYKACEYLGLKAVVTEFDPCTYRADVDQMRAAVTDNTILLMASAPSYAQGVVDPIADIGRLALEKDLLFHVDACMGGVMLSFMRQMPGYDVPDFDFSVPGVTSMSADMHKFGYAAKGASTVVYRDKDLRRHQIFAKTSSTTYALINATMLSSKPGGPMAGAWAVAHFLGREGYDRIFKGLMHATRKLVQGINATGDLRVLGNPDMCIFSFASDTLNVFQLQDEMARRGWYLQPQFSTPLSPHNLHLTVTWPNVPRVDEFLDDLRQAIDAVKNSPNQINLDMVRAQVKSMLDSFGDSALDQLAAMAGVSGADMPKDMALISSILDALPKHLSEALLKEFVNDLYV